MRTTTSTSNIIIVAEISANHQQSYQKAIALIHAAGQVGADAIKVQMFKPESLTIDSNDERFLIKDGQWSGMTLYELYGKACMPYEWVPDLKELAESLGLKFFTTVYDLNTIEITEKLGIEAYKISSFEINYENLIKKVAKTKKSVIISTGTASYKEIETAVRIVRRIHNDITLLKCTSAYPAQLEELNLKTIPAMSHTFRVPVGFSDHTTGIVAPVVATALGAVMLEKHLTLDGKGLDGGFSIMPDRFKTMVETVRAAEKTFGEISYGGTTKYKRTLINGKMVRTVC